MRGIRAQLSPAGQWLGDAAAEVDREMQAWEAQVQALDLFGRPPLVGWYFKARDIAQIALEGTVLNAEARRMIWQATGQAPEEAVPEFPSAPEGAPSPEAPSPESTGPSAGVLVAAVAGIGAALYLSRRRGGAS